MQHAWPNLPLRGLTPVFRVLAFGFGVLVFWVVGLGIALKGDATDAYLHTRPAYLGLAGIISVWLAIVWADVALNRLVETVPSAFARPDEARSLLERSRARMVGWKLPLGAALAVWLVALCYLVEIAGPGCGNLLSKEWYDPKNHGWTTAILLWYSIPVLALLMTTFRGAYRFSILVWQFRSLPISHPIASSAYRLRAVIRWGRISGIWWSLSSVTIILLLEPTVTGVGTAGADCGCTRDVWISFHSMTLARDNVLSIGLGAFATSWALVLLVLPYLCIRQTIDHGVRKAIDALDSAYPLPPESRSDPHRYARAVTTNRRVHDSDVLADAWSRIALLELSPGGIVLFATQIVLPWLPLAAALWR